MSRTLGAVNLSQGFPDDDPPAEILDLFREACKTKNGHQYADPRGIALLRQNIAAKLQNTNGIAADADRNIAVTSGASAALMATFRSLFEPGDEILTFSPVYENYFLQAHAAGIEIKTVELSEPDFALSIERMERARSERLRAILVCNPCNPTGKVFSRDELTAISEFAANQNLIILSDETYERFIWKGVHVSIARLPAAEDRTVTIFSLGKTYSVTGWRIGCVAAPEGLLQPISAMHELTTISAPHPCQIALAHALELPASFYRNMLASYEERKAILTHALLGLGLKPWEPAGSYFLWCNYSQLTGEPDTLFTERLLRGVGVAGVPGQVFYPKSASNPRRIRFTFSKSPATIREAARRLETMRSGLIAQVA